MMCLESYSDPIKMANPLLTTAEILQKVRGAGHQKQNGSHATFLRVNITVLLKAGE